MNLAHMLFWLMLAIVAYAYAGYPLLIYALGKLAPRRPGPAAPAPRSLSIVLAVHNEEGRIARRVKELVDRAGACGLDWEIIVVSDASSDHTAVLAGAGQREGVRVLELPARAGKAAALSLGCAQARHEILVLVDARQSLAPTALPRLLEHFADRSVGAVSGELILSSAPGVLGGVGLYWRYEKWLRWCEGRLYSVVGATGAISAVRRELFRPIPAGTILDDVYWPLAVVMQGYRVLHDPRAQAFDRLPDRAGDEFRRKVRTLCGNYQLLALLPAALLPWRNPIWFQFVSHKVLRLAVPWVLLSLLAVSAGLDGLGYRLALAAQVAVYLVGLVRILHGQLPAGRLASAAASFLLLNSAAWVAFWVWITGHAQSSWHRAGYGPGTGKGQIS